MKRRTLPLFLIVATLLLGACSAAQPEPPRKVAGGAATLPGPVPGDLKLRPAPPGLPAAPAFTGKLTDGTALPVANLWAERPVVLLFFTSWCTTCAQRQAALSDVARTYHDRVVFVGVVAEKNSDDLGTYLSEHRIEYPVVIDQDQTIFRSYAVREPPAVAIVGRGGVLLRGWPGGVDAKTLQDRLRELVIAE